MITIGGIDVAGDVAQRLGRGCRHDTLALS